MERQELIATLCEADYQLNLITGNRGAAFLSRGEGSCEDKILVAISRATGDVYPTDLCDVLDVTTPRITNILNAIEKKGYIERVQAFNDRRKIKVILTEAGIEKARDNHERSMRFFEKVVDKIGLDDAEALLRSMLAFTDIYNEMN